MRLRRRHVGRCESGSWCRLISVTRWQHVGDNSLSFRHRSVRDGRSSGGSSSILSLVSSPRIWVVVNARVTRQFIRATESLRASWKLAGMRLLSSVRPDVSRLMLEAVECSRRQC